MAIQKSLILNFDAKSAKESAEQDWKIDLERETSKRPKGADQPIEGQTESDEESELDSDAESEDIRKRDERIREKQINAFEKKSKAGIDYERLSEFFFDLCLSWCQHLDIETFLFFINGVFLNITEGQHINISTFKDLDSINVLSIEFFNHLLAYRSICEQSKGQTYNQWYIHNF